MPALLETPEPRSNRRGTPICRHCGVPSPAGDFCCSGCAYVYRLVHEAGLDAYYRIKDGITAPADAALLPARNYVWLSAAQHEAEERAGEGTAELTLDVQGISCAGCVWLIEKLFSKQPGSGRIDVNAQTGQMRLAWTRGAFDASAFAGTLQSFNYLVSPASSERSARLESHGLLRRIGLCGAFAMNVMLFTLPGYFGMEATFAYARLFGTLSMVFGTLSLAVGGGYFLNKAARCLREGAMSIDLPIALGIVGAYSGSLYGWISGVEAFVYFDFVSTFILLMLVGRWAQLVAVERNQRRLLAQQPTPPRIKVWNESGVMSERVPEALEAGQIFAIGPGQIVPVEARLESREVTLSLAWINGEAEPRVFRTDQLVPAGAMNVSQSEIQLRATQSWKQSLLAELLKPVERGAYRHRFLERVIRGYLIAILFVAAASAIGWGWATGDVLRTGAVVTAVLVVSCPCAIGLAFPLADEMATVTLRRRGVFVRVTDLWPRLDRVRKLVFDKTGTLTLETPALLDLQELDAVRGDARSALLALVRDNPHPVGRCLHELLLGTGAAEPLAGEVTEAVGFGVMLKSDRHVWTLGRPGWRYRMVCNVLSDTFQRADGETGAEFCRDGEVLARFRFAEKTRSDAREEVAALTRRGLEVSILSGDRREKVTAMTAALGLPEQSGWAELTPHGKADWLARNGAGDALMLGDGANDSLAFDQALCRGTPVVHRGLLAQKADFYYLGRGIGGVRALFEVNDARRRTHARLLLFSIAYNLLAVGLAVAGHMNPLLAAVLMPASSLMSLAIVAQGMHPAGAVARA